ncbi:sensor histidine kinase [Flavobacterium sp.]|uniref:sensor histidine kinase n=1 Tax=Flavobacterium sp. TaxID=239 RepID=UPI003753295A
MLQIQHDEHKQELLSTQIEIQRQTMQHIGREIHDNIGQKLTLASLYTQQLAYENKAPHINENIENISNIINQSLSELRELSKTLTNNAIDSNSIAQLLKQEISKVNELKVVNIDFNSNASHVHLPYQSKSVLLRITQEFIQNSIKHSNCEKITVLLTKQDTTLLLSLQDNGKGFDTSKTKSGGIGLNNMKKRAEIIGGNYNLTSSVNGTKLTIEIELI